MGRIILMGVPRSTEGLTPELIAIRQNWLDELVAQIPATCDDCAAEVLIGPIAGSMAARGGSVLCPPCAATWIRDGQGPSNALGMRLDVAERMRPVL